MNATTASKAYAKVDVESGVLAADPHKLIAMLYQGALLAIATAKNGMMRKNIAAKGAAISKAISIIDDGLNASLDKKVGGEMAQNLSSLYDYMARRLLVANLNNDMGALDEVARLLNDLKGAWESIRPGAAAAAAAPAAEVVPPPARVSQVYAVPAAANQAQAKAAPVQSQVKAPVAQVKPASVAVVPPQAKAASAAPVTAAQPKPVATATAAAPAKAANTPSPMQPQQQRMASKVQSLYGRM
ncbi:MAG: flagellar export chaperone FliS [Sulfuricellaceae bacterium]